MKRPSVVSFLTFIPALTLMSLVSQPVNSAYAASLGAELIQNGNAETGDTSGWLTTGIEIIPAQNFGFLGLSESTDLGNFSFTGGLGPAHSQSLTQSIDVSNLAEKIDSSQIFSTFSLFIQSRLVAPLSDLGTATLSFLDESDNLLMSEEFLDIPVNNVFDWNYFGDERILPVGTRQIQVVLDASRNGGGSSDSAFDQVSLTLNTVPDAKSVPEPSSILGLLALGSVCATYRLLKHRN
ncbi:PEP-CTERM sorting domain-containing protein [Roseofilum capinflatum]|uniref:PEP-CTERM sorting domain-containing protein n=1 Tax=Roseofilum capinflatum BLCC-M114 TaxID=3022440 RepID=A0ABT7BBM6_9CYAN|nr:PEP-CTERM sorting domain-containing protein [Roseofilum capinflatum]MDJ1176551.1 PEP-CTERM sorting domain-containing protein [Roseofilum capinflatum BLCC-M114]